MTKVNGNGSQISYSTYLGGGGFDLGTSLVVDALNNVYVAGITGSTNFPTVNPYQGTFAGSPSIYGDAFVAKLVETRPPTDLSITKVASPDPVAPGSNVTYQLQVTNQGPTTAECVNITDIFSSVAGATLKRRRLASRRHAHPFLGEAQWTWDSDFWEPQSTRHSDDVLVHRALMSCGSPQAMVCSPTAMRRPSSSIHQRIKLHW